MWQSCSAGKPRPLVLEECQQGKAGSRCTVWLFYRRRTSDKRREPQFFSVFSSPLAEILRRVLQIVFRISEATLTPRNQSWTSKGSTCCCMTAWVIALEKQNQSRNSAKAIQRSEMGKGEMFYQLGQLLITAEHYWERVLFFYSEWFHSIVSTVFLVSLATLLEHDL